MKIIAACAACQDIIAWVAFDGVGSGAALDIIVPGTTAERIRSVSTGDVVVTSTATDGVVACCSDNCVVAIGTVDR